MLDPRSRTGLLNGYGVGSCATPCCPATMTLPADIASATAAAILRSLIVQLLAPMGTRHSSSTRHLHQHGAPGTCTSTEHPAPAPAPSTQHPAPSTPLLSFR